MIIWITGLSAAGKTAVCRELLRGFKERLPQMVLLDGDAVRLAFGNDLGYTEADRKVQISRIQRFAKLLSDQGQVVLVSALYSHPDLLEWNRKNLPAYFEVYLKTSMDVLKKRDTKQLYSGKIPNVVGLDIPWNAPEKPDLVVETDSMTPKLVSQKIIDAIPLFSGRSVK